MSVDADDGAPRTGDVLLDRYRIGALIGAGGYGRVYKASDLAAGRAGTCVEVAVKVIHGIDDELRARFAQEAAIVQKLESPHTVRLLDHGISPMGMPFMVLELLEGTSVFDLLDRQQTISPHVALEITAQILDSLAEAHAMGVVHRDIKPENVFVTSRLGQPTKAKLLDFGIAKHGSSRKQLTMQGQVVGTPSYMAPEQTSGKPVDARTDLYAVGLLLAEMVTGRTVMGLGGPLTIMVAQAKNEPVPLGDDVLRSIVGPVVERAVKKAPAERYQSATEMLVAVRALLADVNATSVGPTRVADAPLGARMVASTAAPATVPSGSPTFASGPPTFASGPPTFASGPPTFASGPPTFTAGPSTHASGPPPFASGPSSAADSLSNAPYPSRAPGAHAPSAPTPFISPPPRAKKRKGGPVGLPLAIVGVAAVLSIGIVVVATGSGKDEDPTRHQGPSPRNIDDDGAVELHPKVKYARTSDVAEIRQILRGAGYTLNVDQGTSINHTFAPMKLPCLGSVSVLPQSDADAALRSANLIAKMDTQGARYLIDGRNLITVGIGSSGAPGLDAQCTAAVAALLAK